jgi:hypothetical protein
VSGPGLDELGQLFVGENRVDRQALDLRDGLAKLAQLREHREILSVEHLAVVGAVALPGTSRRRGGRRASSSVDEIHAERLERTLALFNEPAIDRQYPMARQKPVQLRLRGPRVMHR